MCVGAGIVGDGIMHMTRDVSLPRQTTFLAKLADMLYRKHTKISTHKHYPREEDTHLQ